MTDDRESDDRESDDRESDDRETDDRETDDRKTGDRETGDQETDNEASDDHIAEGGDAPEPDGDPFDQFAADVGDREGDPFERLPGEAEEGPEEPPVDETGSGPNGDTAPVDDSSATSGTEDVTEDVAEFKMEFDFGGAARGSEESDPFGHAVDRNGDPFESLDGAFEEMDVGAVDPETVWQDLASAQSRGSVGDPARRTYAEVSKHSYCEQCEYFSAPPEIACQHEGTEIVEFLDMETVRVVDCPIVAERAELQAERSVASQDEDER